MKPKKHPVLQIIPLQKTRSITKEKITRLLTSLVPFCFFEADYMAMRYMKPNKKNGFSAITGVKNNNFRKKRNLQD